MFWIRVHVLRRCRLMPHGKFDRLIPNLYELIHLTLLICWNSWTLQLEIQVIKENPTLEWYIVGLAPQNTRTCCTK
jgi:hypothetical protein